MYVDIYVTRHVCMYVDMYVIVTRHVCMYIFIFFIFLEIGQTFARN